MRTGETRQMEKHFSEKLNKVEISNLSDKKMLNELVGRMDECSEMFKGKSENMKKNKES